MEFNKVVDRRRWRRLRSNVRYAALVFFIFLAVPAIGTITHEIGHAITGMVLGYRPTIHYGSCAYRGGTCEEMSTLWESQGSKILQNPASEVALQFQALHRTCQRDRRWLAAGGPLSTILIGSVGFVWLVSVQQKRGCTRPLSASAWLGTIMALFWSREVVVLLRELAAFSPEVVYAPDEREAALLCGLPHWVFSLGLGAIGLAVCLQVTAWHPARRRLAFVIGGTIACSMGMGIWYGLLGPFILR